MTFIWSRIVNQRSQDLLIQNKYANKLTFKFNSQNLIPDTLQPERRWGDLQEDENGTIYAQVETYDEYTIFVAKR